MSDVQAKKARAKSERVTAYVRFMRRGYDLDRAPLKRTCDVCRKIPDSPQIRQKRGVYAIDDRRCSLAVHGHGGTGAMGAGRCAEGPSGQWRTALRLLRTFLFQGNAARGRT